MMLQLLTTLLFAGGLPNLPQLAVIDSNAKGGLRAPFGRMTWRPTPAEVTSWCDLYSSKNPMALIVAVFNDVDGEPSVVTGSPARHVGFIFTHLESPPTPGSQTWVAGLTQLSGSTSVTLGWSTDRWQAVGAFSNKGQPIGKKQNRGPGASRVIVSDGGSPPKSLSPGVTWSQTVAVTVQTPPGLMAKAERVVVIDRHGNELPRAGGRIDGASRHTWWFTGQRGFVGEIKLQVRDYHWMKTVVFRPSSGSTNTR